jgi:thymidylate kinase
MSETVGFLHSELTLNRVAAREETPIVLPYPQTETDPGDPFCATPSFGKGAVSHSDKESPLPLITKLCEKLNAEQISYCHWKSNWKLKRWLTGEGDLDLLVDRSDKQRFVSIVTSLGFKQAEPSSDRQVPGILNFYGFDGDAGRLVHLHVHYQLVVGHDLTKNYHLPVENLCLEQSARYGLLPIPSREFELILFVLRMVLKYSLLESAALRISGRRSSGTSAVEQELSHLETKIDRALVANLLSRVAPGISLSFFETCLRSLRSRNSFFTRTRIRQQLQTRLESCARRPQFVDALLRGWRRIARIASEQLLHQEARKRFTNGGILIAVVGGDGAGKTTALDSLNKWLTKKFVTKRFHIGKPPRSPITLALIVMLRIRRLFNNASTHPERFGHHQNAVFPGYLQLLRWVSAGRDRRRLYLEARRFATNGGIALCDRYPVQQLQLMESPNIARTVPPQRRNALVKSLLKLEESYYREIMQPDLLIVLRLDPEVAVLRKTGETEHHVRTRSGELWAQDWEGTNAYVIDAGQTAAEVEAEAKSIIWSKL